VRSVFVPPEVAAAPETHRGPVAAVGGWVLSGGTVPALSLALLRRRCWPNWVARSIADSMHLNDFHVFMFSYFPCFHISISYICYGFSCFDHRSLAFLGSQRAERSACTHCHAIEVS
jgi:hypothetical protein